MIGAIAGDIIGSVYERNNIRTTDFELFSTSSTFTDDTVLSVAVADAILHGTDYGRSLKTWYALYPGAGYGASFRKWAISSRIKPYNSWGNGSAMRVSPVGFAFDDIDQVLDEARRSAEVTHNHMEGIKGAQATASAVFLARTGNTKTEIKEYIEKIFGYELNEPIDQIRTWYKFDVSCQGSVPQAITAFLQSSDFEDAIRKAVSIGGDSDTIACIAGGIAQAFYGVVPEKIETGVHKKLDSRLAGTARSFAEKYGLQGSHRK